MPTSWKVKFAEKCFTTGKYQAAQGYLDAFIDNHDYSDLLQILMQALNIGNHIALKKSTGLAKKVDALILKIQDQRCDFKLNNMLTWIIHEVK